MADENHNNGFPDGFLIKDKNGGFKKVQEDGVVDFKPTASPKSAPAPVKQVVPVKTPTVPQKQTPAVGVIKTPAKPISDSTKAALFLDPEDEEDISKHKENLQQMSAVPVSDGISATEIKAKSIANSLNLPITEEVYKKRLIKIIESRLKDIRNSIETEEALSRSKKIGGLELPTDLAKKVVAEVDKVAVEVIGQQAKTKPGEPKKDELKSLKKTGSIFAPPPPSFVPKPGQPLPKPAEPVKPPPPKQIISQVPLMPKPEQAGFDKKFESKTIPRQPKIKPAREEFKLPSSPLSKKEIKPASISLPAQPKSKPKPQPVSPPAEQAYQRPSTDSDITRIAKIRRPEQQRPQVVDIKQPSKILGPVEELADIDLKEFRRMGESPKEAAEKILEKIYLLEEESWEMRMDGLEAWRRSPTYKLYVEIGRESMQRDKTIQTLIQERMNNNQPYLMMEEFLAINDLNSKLNV